MRKLELLHPGLTTIGYRSISFLLLTVFVLALSTKTNAAEDTCDPNIPAVCDATSFCEIQNWKPSSRSFWTSNNGSFEFTSGGQIDYCDNGEAYITGTISQTNNSNDQWEVFIKLENRQSYSELQSNGGSAYNPGNYGDEEDWYFYEVSSESRWFGQGNNCGKSVNISHRPADYSKRVQIGLGANLKDSDFGISSWFDFTGDIESIADLNADLAGCNTDEECPDVVINYDPLCQGLPGSFSTLDLGDGFTYEWNFGSGAEPSTASGNGPHIVNFGTLTSARIRLDVEQDCLPDIESSGDCCDSVEGKPKTMTFLFTGGGCSADNNSQDSKSDCTGGVSGAGPFSISEQEGGNVSLSQVSIGDVFVVSNGGSKLPNPIKIRLNGSQEIIEIHTSCSAPLVAGERFGSVTLLSYTTDQNEQCGTPLPPEPCFSCATYTEVVVEIEPLIECPEDITLDCPEEGPMFGDLILNCDVDACIDYRDDTLQFYCPIEIKRTWFVTVPSPEPTIPDVIIPSGDCCDSFKGDLSAITFRYVGGSCSDGNNDQEGKASCSGGRIDAPSASIKFFGGKVNYFDGTVNLNEDFTISNNGSKLDNNIGFNLTGGGSSMSGEVHGSCSKRIAVGDQFGALVIVGVASNEGEVCGQGNPGGPIGGGSCCDDDNFGKPVQLTFRYVGGGCSGFNSQDEDCSGSVSDMNVNISELDGANVSPSSVGIGQLFTISSGSKLPNPISIRINGPNGQQTVDVHTSCSRPLIPGEIFGALELVSMVDEDGFQCGEDEEPEPELPQCFKVQPIENGSDNGIDYTFQFDENGVPISVTVSGSDIESVKVNGGQGTSLIYSGAGFSNLTAPFNLSTGEVYGINYIEICRVPSDDNINYSGDNCVCEDYIYEFTVQYNGTSGIGGGAYDYHDNEYGYWSLQEGNSYTFNVSGSNHPGEYNDHNDPMMWTYERGKWIHHGTIHSSCSKDILGQSYGPFTVVSYTDVNGNICGGVEEQDECVTIEVLTYGSLPELNYSFVNNSAGRPISVSVDGQKAGSVEVTSDFGTRVYDIAPFENLVGPYNPSTGEASIITGLRICPPKDVVVYTCMQTITINDTEKPTVENCPLDVSITFDDTLPTDEPTFSDNCEYKVDFTEKVDTLNCRIEIKRTWEARDSCDNVSDMCMQTIIIDYAVQCFVTLGKNVSEEGGSDGALNITVEGGFGPYTYEWNNNGPQSSGPINSNNYIISNLSAGTYEVTVTDAYGCKSICEGTVEEPKIVHEKIISKITPKGNNEFTVTYEIEVTNKGGAQGIYGLDDDPDFDDDIEILSASYSSSTPPNLSGPLSGGGLWNLSNDVSLDAGDSHTYTISVEVEIDLNDGVTGDDEYLECSESSTSGEFINGRGLFNESFLLDENETVVEIDTACGDLPYIIMKKGIVGVTPGGNGSYNVTYDIEVKNIGGAEGIYTLLDEAMFDDDVIINGGGFAANFECCPGLAGDFIGDPGELTLTSNTTIAGGATDVFTITFNVTLDLDEASTDGGDNVYVPCTVPGDGPGSNPEEGLYNVAKLDINSDGTIDIEDDACGDLPYIIMKKGIVGVTPGGNGSYNVTYDIEVKNIGGADGIYTLLDEAMFDDDVIINGGGFAANFECCPGLAGDFIGDPGELTLTSNTTIAGGATDVFTITFNVTLDLDEASTDGGDNVYVPCTVPGDGPGSNPEEGLYNVAKLDINSDGTIDIEDDACGDLPFIEHVKTLSKITPNGNNQFTVTYDIVVSNIGGATGIYGLDDEPDFDDDIEILSASYSSSTPPNLSGPLAIDGIWNLSSGVSLEAGASHTYTIFVGVEFDLNDGVIGDDVYLECSENSTRDEFINGQGLFNRSFLLDEYDTIVEIDTACGDLPRIDLELVKKVRVDGEIEDCPVVQVGQSVTFELRVTNKGPQEATNIEVTDYVPDGYGNLNAGPSGGVINGSIITWDIPALDSGQNITLVFVADVLSAINDSDYVNIAEITAADQVDFDSTPGNGADRSPGNGIGSVDDDTTQDPDDEDDGDDAKVKIEDKGEVCIYTFKDCDNNGDLRGDKPLGNVPFDYLYTNGQGQQINGFGYTDIDGRACITLMPGTIDIRVFFPTSPVGLDYTVANAVDDAFDSDADAGGNIPTITIISDTSIEVAVGFKDIQKPTFGTIPNDGTYECHDYHYPATPEAIDNCDDDVTVFRDSTISTVKCKQIIEYTWTATDDCGNQTKAKTTVVINDTTPPVFGTIPNGGNYQCDDVTYPVTPVATDLCDTDVLVTRDSVVTGTCPYIIEYTWTAEDDCGNKTKATTILTIVDTTEPVCINAPTDTIIVECGQPIPPFLPEWEDNCTATEDLVLTGISGVAIDNCIEYQFTTYSATDACGNVATCSIIIKIVDTSKPFFDGLVPDEVISCGEPLEFGTPAYLDLCDKDVDISYKDVISVGDCPLAKVVTRTWTITDDCGNTASTSAKITVIDDNAPIILDVPNNASYECDEVVLPATPKATDLCDPYVTVYRDSIITPGDPLCPQNYIITYTWTAIDACGNKDTEQTVITVKDTKEPVILNAPTDTIVVECGQPIPPFLPEWEDNCTATEDLVLTGISGVAMDNCIEYQFATYTATDACGNVATYSRFVKIVDTTTPVCINAPTDTIIVECGQPVPPFLPEWEDNCTATEDLVLTGISGVAIDNCIEYQFATYTATDACGNVATCSRFVKIVDTSKPFFDGLVPDKTVNCYEQVEFGTPAFYDNCGIPTLTHIDEKTIGECPNEYTITRTWTIEDRCGNTATTSAKINVVDNEGPKLLNIPNNKTYECDAIEYPKTPTAFDLCVDDVIVDRDSTITYGQDCHQSYVINYIWTATDGCNEPVTGYTQITVVDTKAPLLSEVTPEVVVNLANGDVIPSVPNVTASDNCDNDVLVKMDTEKTPVDCGYIITYTWSAEDDCGNKATRRVQKVIVLEGIAVSIAPTIAEVCEGYQTTFTASPAGSEYTYQWSVNGGGTINATNETAVFNAETVGSYTVKVTVTSKDGPLCTGSDSAVVTITDKADPIKTEAKFCIEDGYVWSVNETTYSEPGTYTVTGEACVADRVLVLTLRDDCTKDCILPVIEDISITDVECEESLGSATVVLTADPSNYRFTWIPDLGTPNTIGNSRTDLPAAMYDVIITYPGAEACFIKTKITINGDAGPSVDDVSISTTDATCGEDNGTADLGPDNYLYSWPDGSMTDKRNDLAVGVYTVKVIDPATPSCPIYVSVTIGGGEDPLSANAIVTNGDCNTLGAISLTVSGGDGNYIFDWAHISGNDDAKDLSDLESGNYTVIITDSKGCAETLVDIPVMVNCDPCTIGDNIKVETTDETCSSRGSARFTPSSYTYTWLNDDTQADFREGLKAGTYMVQANDPQTGCTVVVDVVIDEVVPKDATIQVDDISMLTCANENGATVDFTVDYEDGLAQPAEIFIVDENAQRITNGTLTAGDYCIYVKDANGCTVAKKCFMLKAPTPITSNHEVLKTTCDNDGVIDVTMTSGTAPYTFAWSDDGTVTSEDRTDLAAGTYSVTIVDANSCQTIISDIIVESDCDPCANGAGPIVEVSKMDAGCEDNGFIKLMVPADADYHYDWSDFEAPNEPKDRAGLAPATYEVTVTDANGCAVVKIVTISSNCMECNDGPAITASKTDVTCNENGSITLTLTSSTGAVRFDWLDVEGSDNDMNRTDLPEGNYTVIATDDKDCDVELNYTIADNCDPNIDCEIFTEDTLSVSTTDCENGAKVCLGVDLQDFRNLELLVNDQPYNGGLTACNYAQTFYYDFEYLMDVNPQGPYDLITWSFDDQAFGGRSFATVDDIAAFIIASDPSGNWSYDKEEQRVIGGNTAYTYTTIELIHPETQAKHDISLNVISVPSNVEVTLPEGIHEVVIIDSVKDCEDMVIVTVTCVNDEQRMIFITMTEGEDSTYCFNAADFNLDGPIDNVSLGCEDDANRAVDFNLNVDNDCIEIYANDIGEDDVCLKVCDASSTCDSVLIIVNVVEPQGGNGPLPNAVDNDTLTTLDREILVRALDNDQINGVLMGSGITSEPSHGTVVEIPGVGFQYTPSRGFCGEEDNFQYFIENENGRDTAMVTVMVACDEIIVFSGFSPNRDGINDRFEITGIENYPNNTVCVFNRWGNQVFFKKGYTNVEAWEGDWNEGDLPDGTYFYMIDLGEDGDKKSGYVQIMR